MSFISKFFGNKEDEFNEVRVDREVLESVIYYSKKSFPNEFLAFFDGLIKDNILYITGLIFIPGETGKTGAVVHTEMLPMNTKYWGSVHSHPGPSARPSDADLVTFSKNGFFHMIVCLPYSFETFKAYDRHGNSQDYTVGDYSHMIEDDDYEFFDEDDVLRDDDEFKPGFFDESDDEFFKTDSDEKGLDAYNEYENRNHNRNQITITPDDLSKNLVRIEIDGNGNIRKIYKKD